tara:strand:- start:159 stop:584 length:426 start_codon:yes stop_codon:yes gene_type:complete
MNNKYGIMRISIFYRILKTFFGSSFATLAINPIVLSSCVVKNSKDIQFRTDKTFHAIEDWFLWIDLSLKEKKFTKINQNLVSYRMHESSISKIDGLKQYLKGFNLYSALLLENKITINKYLILQFIHYLRILKYKVFGRNS